MGWLSDLLGFELRKDGIVVATRKVLDFIGDGWTLSDNPGNGRAEVRFTAAASTDPTTGFTVRLLPQVDASPQTANATPVDVATIAIDDNTIYQFAVYCHAYAAAYAQDTLIEYERFFQRTAGGAPADIGTKAGLSINPLGIPGATLVASGNNIIVRWTGHSATTLKARVQCAFITRPVLLPA